MNMGKIININEYRQDYTNQIQLTIEYLESMRDELFTHMINIASCGVWKNWMKEIQCGDSFQFSEDMLHNTDDKNVETLWKLCYKIEEVEERLKRKKSQKK
jgi:hypothetical protein